MHCFHLNSAWLFQYRYVHIQHIFNLYNDRKLIKILVDLMNVDMYECVLSPSCVNLQVRVYFQMLTKCWEALFVQVFFIHLCMRSQDRFTGVTLGNFSVATDGTVCPGVDSASKNEYQGIPLGVKAAGA
jgi:hypothetical protein